MSDGSQGPGWWQASDGRWYPPETHPDYQPPSEQPASTLPPRLSAPSDPVRPSLDQSPEWPWWKRHAKITVVLVAAALFAVAGLAEAAGIDAESLGIGLLIIGLYVGAIITAIVRAYRAGDRGWALAIAILSPFLIGLVLALLYLFVINRQPSSKELPTSTVIVTPQVSLADELRKLDELRSDGVLTDAEFEAQKARLLRGSHRI